MNWKPDPYAVGTDAFQLSWLGLQGYTFSPFALHQEVHSKDSAGEEHSGTNNTLLANTSLVSSSSGVGSVTPTTLIKETRPPDRSTQSASLTSDPGQTLTSHLESIREKYLTAGVLQETADLLFAGWNQGINTAYESGYKR